MKRPRDIRDQLVNLMKALGVALGGGRTAGEMAAARLRLGEGL